jgi:hypothetical protein
MIDYYSCIKLKYPTITDDDFEIIDNNSSISIQNWNLSFGEIPTLEELSTYNLQVLKNNKKEEIKQFVYNEIERSTVGYQTVGLSENLRIDAGRGDLDNLRNLKQYCQSKNTSQTFIKDFYNNMHQISIEDLDIIILELIAYGLWLYQRKWEVDMLIENATTEEEINSISFFS